MFSIGRLLDSKGKMMAAAALLAAIALILYWPAIRFGFVSLDDYLLVVQNPAIQSWSFANFKHIFTSFDPELYIPLTFVSYLFDATIGGMQPGMFHFTNIVLHALNAALIFLCLDRITKRRSIAFLAALLFAVHPINVEAVSWVAARKDLLSSVFALLSTLFFLKNEQHPSVRFFVGSISAFLLALLSKVTVLMLPVALFAIVIWQKKNLREASIKTAPYFGLSLIFGIVAILGKTRNLVQVPFFTYPVLALKSIVFYLQKIFLPLDLTVLYQQRTPATLISAEFFVPLVIIVAIVIACALLWKKLPAPALGFGFFLLMLFPSFFTVVKNTDLYFASDRYVYLASLGILTLIAFAVDWLLHQDRISHTLTAGLSVVIVIALAWIAHAQAMTWQSNTSLFAHVLSVDPQSALAYNNLGSELMNESLYDEALADFQRSAAIDPHYILPRINIANVYRNQGKNAEALDAYRAAIAAIPAGRARRADDLIPYYFLAESLDGQGKTQQAESLYREAAQRGAAFAEPQFNLGVFLQKYRRYPEAVDAYRRTTTLDPNYIAAHYYLAAIYGETGKLEDAEKELTIVIGLNPDYEEAQQHLTEIKAILHR